MRHLEAENKELKGRIERQEAFQKRRMEKEKRDKRVRSGSVPRGAVSGASGKKWGTADAVVFSMS